MYRQDVCSTYIPSSLKGEGQGKGKEFDGLVFPPLRGGIRGRVSVASGFMPDEKD